MVNRNCCNGKLADCRQIRVAKVYLLDYNYSPRDGCRGTDLPTSSIRSPILAGWIENFGPSVRFAESLQKVFIALLARLSGKNATILTLPAGYSSDHRTLRAAAAAGEFELVEMPIDGSGHLDLQFMQNLPCPPALVSIPFADPATGLIMPLADVFGLASSFPEAFVHIDITAAIGNAEFEGSVFSADLITLSAGATGSHSEESKILILPGNSRLARSVCAISDPCSPSSAVSDQRFDKASLLHRHRLRTAFEDNLLSRIPAAKILFAGVQRLFNTTAISIYGINAESLTAILERRGVRAVALSLCARTPQGPYPFFGAAGIPFADTIGAVHLSFGFDVTTAELDAAAAIIADCTASLRKSGIQ
ncbi:MAG: hypothetical protein C4325_14215 [Blastocatellia bacterium]